MALNASEVVVAGFGHIYLGDETAEAPDDVAAPVGLGWTELGYASEDGVTIGRSIDSEDIMAWQSATAVRRIITGAELTLATTLIQTNEDTLGLYFGGSAASGRLAVPATPDLDEHAVLVEWVDGTKTYRLYVGRAVVSDYGDVTLARGDAVGFEVTFTALPPATGNELAVVLSPVPTP